jgi:transcriptional regulator CtsR
MPKLSDLIEDFIKEMMLQSNDNFLEIQRNELAYNFNCAPSQINYVLTTRFTVGRGYYVESKRGGGGCIKITWVDIDKNEYIKNAIWNSIGDELSCSEAEDYIELFLERGFTTEGEARIMKAVINDKTISSYENAKNQIRAKLLKTMLIAILN